MPFYRVWYRDNDEPLEFSTASICREDDIVGRVLAHEGIASPGGAAASPAPALNEIIAANQLGKVRYTEDESEMHSIG